MESDLACNKNHKHAKENSYSTFDADIERIEATLNSLTEELQKLKRRKQEIYETRIEICSNCKNRKITYINEKNESHSVSELLVQSSQKSKKNKKNSIIDGTNINSDTIDSLENESNNTIFNIRATKRKRSSEITNEETDVNETKSRKKKRKKETDSIQSNVEPNIQVTEENSKEDPLNFYNRTTLVDLNRLDSIKQMVTDITEEAIEFSDKKHSTKIQNTSHSYSNNNSTEIKQDFTKCEWKREKLHLRNFLKSGRIRLDFKGSNIDKIPGYGKIIHE